VIPNRAASRSVPLAVLALSLAGCGEPKAPPPPDFEQERAWATLVQQVSFGPRYPGGRGAGRQAEWLLDELKFRADTVYEQKFMGPGEGGRPVPMSNVLARFRPELKDRVLLVAYRDTRRRAEGSMEPLDRRFPTPGANLNASAVAVLMELTQLFRQQPPPVGVDLLLTDGDGVSREADFAGTRHFLASMPGYRPRYAILVQGVGDREALIPRDSLSVAGAAEATGRVWAAAKALHYDSVFVDAVARPVENSAGVLAAAGIPVVVVADREYGPGNVRWHSIDDKVEYVSRETLGLVGRVLAAALYAEAPAEGSAGPKER
jgi:glutaminyl-peptide cyclotransferase